MFNLYASKESVGTTISAADALHNRPFYQHVGFNWSSSFSSYICDRITVRQTVDPYVNDIEYIASREVCLESDGSLSLSKIGLGMPGDKFFVRNKFNLGRMLANGAYRSYHL